MYCRAWEKSANATPKSARRVCRWQAWSAALRWEPLGIGIFYFAPQLVRRATLTLGLFIAVFISSQALVRVEDPTLPTGLWLILAGPLWSALAAYFLPRRYREAEADDRNVLTAAALGGFAIGPLIFGLLWQHTPKIDRDWMIALGSLGAWQIYTLFAVHNADNLCVAAPYHITYLAQQTANGVVIGCIYSLMAVGLTLIYSVQGIVSFAHGQLLHGWRLFFFLLLAAWLQPAQRFDRRGNQHQSDPGASRWRR